MKNMIKIIQRWGKRQRKEFPLLMRDKVGNSLSCFVLKMNMWTIKRIKRRKCKNKKNSAKNRKKSQFKNSSKNPKQKQKANRKERNKRKSI